LGGVDKGLILGVLKPHIFFDDQSGHLNSTSSVAPSVHIPFGVKNTDAIVEGKISQTPPEGQQAVES
ncbi:5'-nucleotidase, partial [Aeromonas molluscorum]|uniref:5'-nucleotidase n=1 Tax=Aeromonas molluscorum TaxID=271417 RepID=UPI001375ACFE